MLFASPDLVSACLASTPIEPDTSTTPHIPLIIPLVIPLIIPLFNCNSDTDNTISLILQ